MLKAEPMSAFRTSEKPQTRAGRGRPGKPKKRRGGGGARRVSKKTGDVRSLPGVAEQPVAKAPKGPLGGKAIRHLRGLGHHLDPIVQVGKEGVTEAVVRQTRDALRAHELVKIKVLAEAPVDRHEAGEELARATGATLAQTLGRTLLLYLRHPTKPKIALPQ